MPEKKIHLEYILDAASQSILWNAISTAAGLQRWFAEEVTNINRSFTFKWSKDEIRQAELTNIRTNSFVRFHWTDDKSSKNFFEMRISQDELTGDHVLEITDFAEEGEEEELAELWKLNIATLKRVYGLE